METDVAKFYKYMGPRTLALVTSLDKEKHVEIEPLSFLSPASMKPPMIVMSIGAKQDTLKNIRASRQFVINIPQEEMLEKIIVFLGNASHEPDEPDKMDKAGLSSVPATKVLPPLIYESIAWIECLLEYEKEAGDHVIVVGRVVNVSVRDNVLAQDGTLDLSKAKILMHLGGMKFSVAEREITAKKEETK